MYIYLLWGVNCSDLAESVLPSSYVCPDVLPLYLSEDQDSSGNRGVKYYAACTCSFCNETSKGSCCSISDDLSCSYLFGLLHIQYIFCFINFVKRDIQGHDHMIPPVFGPSTSFLWLHGV